MRLYTKRLKDGNGQENWIIYKEGEYSSPVAILYDFELDIFIQTIQDERKIWKEKNKK